MSPYKSMEGYKNIAAIVNEDIPRLTPIHVRKRTVVQDMEDDERKFYFGSIDSCFNEEGHEIFGVRVFHTKRGKLNKTSHKGSYRRDEEKGILLPFAPTRECPAHFWYIILD